MRAERRGYPHGPRPPSLINYIVDLESGADLVVGRRRITRKVTVFLMKDSGSSNG